ncbi:MAG TPA: carbon monoxide dehydrogenase, partial [Methanomicrobiales archaeon]|nr:carbon monoxide dehydrogenase [Methanomicrobiales archaeon]
LGFPLLAADVVIAVLAGTALFPLLLPVIPTKDFSTKGFILGVLVMIPSAAIEAGTLAPIQVAAAAATLLFFPPITAYLALNFTGSTPYTSRTGVKKEIFRYVPVMAAFVVLGVIVAAIGGILHALGVI